MKEAPRLLGVDLGDVRIGLALSDPLGCTAQPLPPIESRGDPRDAERLKGIANSHGVARVVLGLPLTLSGASGTRAVRAQAMADRLRQIVRVPVDLWDERLTSRQAERVLLEGGVRRKKRREVIDSLAAVVLLQSYLEAHREPRANGPGERSDPP